MTGFIQFRQNKFSAIESLAQNLQSTLQELARLEKDNKYLFLQAEATMVYSLAKNAASSINHLVRLNLDNEKAIAVMKTVANYLHTAYIRVYKYTGYIAQKLEQLLHEAFNLLPSGMTLQPELFAPNEIHPVRENKTPILSVIANWFKDNAQRWAFQQQQKLDKQYFDYITNGKQKSPVAVQLCLDLESVTLAYPVDSPQVVAQKLAALGDVEFEVESETRPDSSWSRGDRLKSGGCSGMIADVKGNKAKIDWDNGYSEVYSFEQIQRYGYQKFPQFAFPRKH